jgi:allantoate deiminase
VTLFADGVNGDRLLERLDALGRCGLRSGERFRALYDDGWVQATALVAAWMEDAGLRVRRDAVGNVWGRLDRTEGGRVIVTGSHIDTVRGGGALDGAFGVVAGIEALAALRGSDLRRTLETVAFCEEEGSRFDTQFWGSRAVIGDLTPEEADSSRDDDGTTLASAMRARGLDPARAKDAARDDIETFVELHIEQGAVLHEEGPRLAVVSAIAGTAHLEVEVRGSPDHAGTTPMSRRRDALSGAAAMIEAIAKLARDQGEPAVATVGRITVEPAQVNVVPGVASFTVDARHSVEAERRRLAEAISAACRLVAAERGLSVRVAALREREVVVTDERVSAVLRGACRAVGVEPRTMPSAALQDSQIMAARSAIGMIFVPSIGGRSHRMDEATNPEDLVLGARALTAALGALATDGPMA